MTKKIENEPTTERLLPFMESNSDQPCQSQTSETSDACSIPVVIRDFVVHVERTYKGLGLQVLYGTLSILANKSVFFIGGRGSGKTRTISCIPDVENTLTSKCDAFTLGELDNLCGEYGEALLGVRNKHFVFKVEEFATLGEYHREIFLTVCSKLSSDGNYRHITSITPNLVFEDCKLTMLIAIQPILYSLLCFRHHNWEAMSYDRFTKFLMLNPLRTDTVEECLVPTLPRKIPFSATVPDTVNIDKLEVLFRGHVSEGRARLYARDYAKAIARFQGKNEVTEQDVEIFYKLFSPYLESFSSLQQREDLESRIHVSSGHVEVLTEIGKTLEGISKQDLSRNLMVTTDHIVRCARLLLDKELIREEDDKYHLSTDLEQFFNWYKDTFSVQMSQTVEGT